MPRNKTHPVNPAGRLGVLSGVRSQFAATAMVVLPLAEVRDVESARAAIHKAARELGAKATTKLTNVEGERCLVGALVR
jgi:hypothetical protein